MAEQPATPAPKIAQQLTVDDLQAMRARWETLDRLARYANVAQQVPGATRLLDMSAEESGEILRLAIQVISLDVPRLLGEIKRLERDSAGLRLELQMRGEAWIQSSDFLLVEHKRLEAENARLQRENLVLRGVLAPFLTMLEGLGMERLRDDDTMVAFSMQRRELNRILDAIRAQRARDQEGEPT